MFGYSIGKKKSFPGSVPAALLIETIMEHVAKAVDKHPMHVKELNLYEKGQVSSETKTNKSNRTMNAL